MKKHRG